MRNRFVKTLSLLVILLSLTFMVSRKKKKPEEGYISKEEVTNNIIVNFENKALYTKYSVKGTFNYFDYSEDKVLHFLFPGQFSLLHMRTKHHS